MTDWYDVLQVSPDAEPAVTPPAEFLESFAGRAEFGEHAFGVLEKVFTGLCQRHLPAHPVQKPTTNIALQSLDGVADGGLGEEQLSRGLREAAVAREDRERLKLLTVDGAFHP